MSSKRRDWYEDNKDDESLTDVYPQVDFGQEYPEQEEYKDAYYSITQRMIDQIIVEKQNEES
jgi:hypothetical protein